MPKKMPEIELLLQKPDMIPIALKIRMIQTIFYAEYAEFIAATGAKAFKGACLSIAYRSDAFNSDMSYFPRHIAGSAVQHSV